MDPFPGKMGCLCFEFQSLQSVPSVGDIYVSPCDACILWEVGSLYVLHVGGLLDRRRSKWKNLPLAEALMKGDLNHPDTSEFRKC